MFELFGTAPTRLFSLAMMAVLVHIAGCCETTEITGKVNGPDRVVAGQPAVFDVHDAGFDGDSVDCPAAVNWFFESDASDATQKPDLSIVGTKEKPVPHTAFSNACVTNHVPAQHVFPAGAPCSERVVPISAVVMETFGELQVVTTRKVTVVTPAAAGGSCGAPAGGGGGGPPPPGGGGGGGDGGGGGGGGGTTGGGASFGTPAPYHAGTHPVGVAVADLGGSTALAEVAAVSDEPAGNQDVADVLFPDGAGKLSEPQTYPLGTDADPRAIAATDLDKDGKLDLAIANYGAGNGTAMDSVTVLRNTGDGAFAQQGPYDADPGPSAIATGDLDGDGFADVAVASADVDQVSVLHNAGAAGPGVLESADPWDSGGDGPKGLAIGDLTGDGKPDVVVANTEGSTLDLLVNTSPPPGGADSPKVTFAAPQQILGGTDVDVNRRPRGLGIADTDADGDADVVVTNVGQNSVSWLESRLAQGDPSFVEHPYATGENPRAVTLADLDLDGKLDVATANTVTDDVSVLINLGHGFSSETAWGSGAKQPQAVGAGEIDGSAGGRPDLVVANFASTDTGGGGNVTVLRSLGPAPAWPSRRRAASRGRRAGVGVLAPRAAARLARKRRKALRATATGGLSLDRQDAGTVTFTPDGTAHVEGAIVTGRLNARVTRRRVARKLPRALRRILDSDIAGSVSGTNQGNPSGTGIVARGLLVARSRARRHRTTACLRLTIDGRPGRERANRLKLLGATRAAGRIRMTGALDPFRFGALPETVRMKVTRGAVRRPSRACRKLARRLPHRR